MSDEKPLHVRVAQALGWKNFHLCDGTESLWIANDPDTHPEYIPRYDLEWSATGPLIEKYKISVVYRNNRNDEYHWWADSGYYESGGWDGSSADASEDGDTPLIAVCNLILALKEAGKL